MTLGDSYAMILPSCQDSTYFRHEPLTVTGSSHLSIFPLYIPNNTVVVVVGQVAVQALTDSFGINYGGKAITLHLINQSGQCWLSLIVSSVGRSRKFSTSATTLPFRAKNVSVRDTLYLDQHSCVSQCYPLINRARLYFTWPTSRLTFHPSCHVLPWLRNKLCFASYNRKI